jgi:PucR family transcriptional regulator, purine catabolism regulatory protein
MSSCTVAQLAGDPSLRLRVLVDGGNLDRLVRGVHVSDLEHPAQYVLPGELLLTNGLWLGQTEPRQWVEEAQAAGAVAVGYGVGTPSPVVPAELREACTRLGVPLIEVPEDLSFSAIGECVVEHNRTQDATVRLQLTRLRRLLQELARGEGHAAVLELLRRETRLPVWLVGPGGRSLTDDAPADAGVARAAARAARCGDLPSAVAPALSAFGVANALSTTAVIVGAPLAEVSDDARLIIEQATAYLILEDARQREHETVRSRMAEELLQLLWDGELGSRALNARLRALDLHGDEPITLIASANSERDVTYAAMGSTVPCVSTVHRDARILLVQSGDEAAVEEIAELIRDGGADPVLGTGRGAGANDGLRRALAEAISALQLARSRPQGERVVCRLDVGSHGLLLDFIDPPVLRAFRDSVIGPVERWDEQHGSQLLETLAAFFAHDGHWRKTAADLHIHHNTLHYRLDKVAQLTGRPVESTASRVDFALALAIPRAATPPAPDQQPAPRGPA